MRDGRRGRGSPQLHTLLLVEDNQGDARLIEEALSPTLEAGLHVVSTGTDALDFVNQRGSYADVPPPDLILLDWHLPETDGDEVLAELNDDPDLVPIPVIVLTGSQSRSEIQQSYSQHANACITKEANPQELEETLQALEDFWLSVARLPCAPDELLNDHTDYPLAERLPTPEP